MKRLTTLIFISLVFFQMLSGSMAGAQTTTGTSARRSVATIMFAGLAGAVLGLSTLSFYGSPQDHIGNIWTGLAVGALAGTGYVVNQQMQQNQASLNNPWQGQMPAAQTTIARGSHPIFRYQWDF